MFGLFVYNFVRKDKRRLFFMKQIGGKRIGSCDTMSDRVKKRGLNVYRSDMLQRYSLLEI